MNPKQHSGIKWRTLMAALTALALATGMGRAQSTNEPADNSTITDFSSFQVIPQRNIFNPNRFPNERVNYQSHNSQVVPEFTLVGTMSYRKGMFAFFSGTEPDYQKAVQEGGTIAGFTVTNINLVGVQMLSTNLSTNMMVGQAMQQEGDGWALNGNGETYNGTSGASSFREGREGHRRRGNYEGSFSPPEAAPAGAASPATSSDLSGNDVLKKLMQQRQQELK